MRASAVQAIRVRKGTRCKRRTDRTFLRHPIPFAGHDEPAAETMRHFNLSRDYIVRLLNEIIARCESQDIRNWKSGERCPLS
jgi:hypothetical protein